VPRAPLFLREVALEETCDGCGGTGELITERVYRSPCPCCEGLGVTLTEVGQALLRFVGDHLRSADSNVLLRKPF
jgi:predicted methyltransferase